MSQLHRRFADDQIRVLVQGCCQGKVTRADVQDLLGIGKTRFFSLVKSYRHDPETFSIAYQRTTSARLSPEVEAKIESALLREKQIVEDPDLPISNYNYSALRDRLHKEGIDVSLTTIIRRAKQWAATSRAGRRRFMIERCSPLPSAP